MHKSKRKNFREPIPSEDYWMGMAFFAGANSRSPSGNGAVIVSPGGQLIAFGCDAVPRSMHEGEYFRSAEKIVLQEAFRPLVGATIFLTFTPNPDGLLDIIGADIRRTVYFPTEDLNLVCKEIVGHGCHQLVEYKGNLNWIRDHVAAWKVSGVF